MTLGIRGILIGASLLATPCIAADLPTRPRAVLNQQLVPESDVTVIVRDVASGSSLVDVTAINRDPSAFPVEFAPGHEAADENGYVMMPNVNVLIEMADMTEANRSYEANLQVIKQARSLISMTIDLMRNQ